MVDSILHWVRWVKLVNRYRLLLSTVRYVMREKGVVGGERGERMMVMVRIEVTVMRLRTHTL